MKTLSILSVGLLALTLSACGNSTTERALSGGAIGAGAGAAAGALTGGSATTGAVIGGLGGAAIGGLTDKDDISFDR